jgi:hypothetical protein
LLCHTLDRGHAGASGYIAAMVLVCMSPIVIKPMELILNIIMALDWQFSVLEGVPSAGYDG